MELNIIIGIVCSMLGAAVGYAGFARSKTKDDKGEGQEKGVMLTELGYIKSSVEGVNKKLDRMEERNLEFVERLSAVEASAKQANKRLDRIEGVQEDHHERMS